MRALGGFAILVLTSTASGWCSVSAPKSIATPIAAAIPTATPAVTAKAPARPGTPAGPGKMVVTSGPPGQESRELVSSGIPLSADQLPKLDLDRIHSLSAPRQDFPKATEATVVKTYQRLNPADSPGYDDGLIAVQLYALHATLIEEHGECWFQAAGYHADLARQSGNKDLLVKAISAAFHIAIDDIFKGDQIQQAMDEVRAAQGSEYPPLVKVALALVPLPSLSLYVDNQADPGMKPGDERYNIPPLLDAGVADLEDMAKQGVPVMTLYACAQALLNQTTINGHRPCEPEFTSAGPQSFKGAQRDHYQKLVEDALTRAKAPGEVVDILRADYLIALAWGARGVGLGDSVTPEMAAKMDAYLEQASISLAEAEKKYPRNVVVPTLMLTVALGSGMAIPEMDEWFHKAIAIDPAYHPAYAAKLNFLQPKWYGSGQQMLDFGVECFKSGDWDDGVPLVFITGMNMLSETESGFFAKHPDVAKGMDKIFREYLSFFPESLEIRTSYLCFAYNIQDWDVTKEQLAILDNYWDMTQISPWDYSEIVEAVAKH